MKILILQVDGMPDYPIKELGNGEHTLMKDYSAGHITSEEARDLILFINKNLKYNGIEFFPGVSYRHIMLWKKWSIERKYGLKGAINAIFRPCIYRKHCEKNRAIY